MRMRTGDIEEIHESSSIFNIGVHATILVFISSMATNIDVRRKR
jgi:hypothetical protein